MKKKYINFDFFYNIIAFKYFWRCWRRVGTFPGSHKAPWSKHLLLVNQNISKLVRLSVYGAPRSPYLGTNLQQQINNISLSETRTSGSWKVSNWNILCNIGARNFLIRFFFKFLSSKSFTDEDSSSDSKYLKM